MAGEIRTDGIIMMTNDDDDERRPVPAYAIDQQDTE